MLHSSAKIHLRTPVFHLKPGPEITIQETHWQVPFCIFKNSHGVFCISKGSCVESSSPALVHFFFMHYLPFPPGKIFTAPLRDRPMLGPGARPHSNVVPFAFDSQRLPCMYGSVKFPWPCSPLIVNSSSATS